MAFGARILCVAFVIAACGLIAPPECSAETRALLAITLPPSPADLSESCASGFNPTYRAEFQMSPDDLETLQQATPVLEWEGDETTISGVYGDGILYVEATIDISDPAQFAVTSVAALVD
ncbi:MAG: hypothetical protein GYB67_04660 [Chloroflexi bacterium]|nr:hypothetical protein [Chloroflexota bacterium]